jgi:hypothetical protein
MITGLKREMMLIKDRKKQAKLADEINEMIVKESLKQQMGYTSKSGK